MIILNKFVLIVAKCIVNIAIGFFLIFGLEVLIVAKCIVNDRKEIKREVEEKY